MACDQIAITLPKKKWNEGSGFSVTANFRNRATASAVTPTTVQYRLDCLTTAREVLPWTTVSPSTGASIAITGAQNAIIDDCNDFEKKQVTVMTDEGLSTQSRAVAVYTIDNIYGVT